MKRRLGFVGIIVEERNKVHTELNEVLSEYGDHIVARVGMPYKERDCSVITLVVDMNTNEVGALTGKLGALESVLVKSALVKNH